MHDRMMNKLPSDPRDAGDPGDASDASADDEETTEIWSQLRTAAQSLFRRSDSSELNRRVTKVFEEACVSHLPTIHRTKILTLEQTSGEEESNSLTILFHHVLFWRGGGEKKDL